MENRLIPASEYTDVILEAIDTIKENGKSRLDIDMADSDISVFEFDNEFIYVIGNPVVMSEKWYDDCGKPQISEVKNVTLEYRDRQLTTEWDGVSPKWPNVAQQNLIVSSFIPHLVIMHQFLLARIRGDKVEYGH